MHGLRRNAEGAAENGPEERKALYDQTLQSTESLCAQARTNGALLDRCADSAAFLRAFPECDDACQSRLSVHRRGPKR